MIREYSRFKRDQTFSQARLEVVSETHSSLFRFSLSIIWITSMIYFFCGKGVQTLGPDLFHNEKQSAWTFKHNQKCKNKKTKKKKTQRPLETCN